MKKSKSLISFIDDLSINENNACAVDLMTKFEHLNRMPPFIQKTLPIVFLLNYSTKKFLFYSNSVKPLLGYYHEELLEGGVDFAVEKYHPADFETYNKKIFKKNIDYLNTLTKDQQSDYIFSHTIRIKDSENNYQHVLQRNTYFNTGDSRFPTIVLGVLSLVPNSSREQYMIHTIEKSSGNDGGNQRPLSVTKFFTDTKDCIISKREIEILKWIANGFSSKQIGSKLFLSTHTVNNHRKNILMKTGCKNSAELIQYSAQMGYLV